MTVQEPTSERKDISWDNNTIFESYMIDIILHEIFSNNSATENEKKALEATREYYFNWLYAQIPLGYTNNNVTVSEVNSAAKLFYDGNLSCLNGEVAVG
jgi:hypothetical protein